MFKLFSSNNLLRSLISDDDNFPIVSKINPEEIASGPYKPEYALYEGSPAPTPTPIRISTMTITCHMGSAINLNNLYRSIPMIEYWEHREGVIQIDYVDGTRGQSKRRIFRRTTTDDTRKPFYNQATLVYKWYEKLADGNRRVKEANIKIFLNGGLQMTGVPTYEDAKRIIESIVEIIRASSIDTDAPIAVNPAEMTITKLSIQLVNSDFDAKFNIDRYILCKILTGHYRLFASFEATAYQGVNTKFYWNQSTRDRTTDLGRCLCEPRCDGKTMDDPSKCKKITISPFQTGKVIITGARTIEQIDDAYKFICEVFRKYYGVIRKKVYVPVTREVKDKEPKKRTARRKTILISRDRIINAELMRGWNE
jgi:TATA-box binding protein (TBP) (component of TFIID and TFIIIB)